jgi:hypothetical protein
MVAGAEKLESEVVAVDPAAVVQEEAFGAEQVQEQVSFLYRYKGIYRKYRYIT